MIKKLVLKSIKLYMVFFSPYLSGNCKYSPSCSNYGYQAVEKYGGLMGAYLILRRLIKCNPFSRGGYDPVI